MNTKNISMIVIILLLAGGAFWYKSAHKEIIPAVTETTPNDQRVSPLEPPQPKPEESLKTEAFSGKLEEVNTGCFVDGECYVVVSGKHVTVVMGWSQETVGKIIGVESIGDLEAHKGEEMNVYAQKKTDGTYTLYGSENFYVRLK